MDSTSTTKVRDKLIAGIDHIITETRLVLTAPAADKTYARGMAIARNSATDKLVPYVLGGSDGTGDIYAILADEQEFLAADTDDRNIVIYIQGQFNQNEISFDGAGAISDIRAQARERGIFLEAAIYDNDSV